VTQPPQPGPWGAQPPQQPGSWQGYPVAQPGPHGQWNPQQQWVNPQPVPPKKGPLKWIIGAAVLIAVVAVTVMVTVSFTDGNAGSAPTSGAKSGVASANDTGPVSVITEDPSCAPWYPINNIVADAEKNGWTQRDLAMPASAWTPDIRAMYKSVGDAMRTAADQTVPLAKIATHRVLRELYEQYIAYTRQFVDHIPTFTQADNNVVGTAAAAASVISDVCGAISYGSAATRGPLVAAGDAPQHTATAASPDNPRRFLEIPDSQCGGWIQATSELERNPVFQNWLKVGSNIPAGQWSAQDKLDNEAVKPVLSRAVDTYDQLGRRSQDATITDFAMLAVQYGRAFIQGMPTYAPADIHLYMVFLRAPGVIATACKAAGAN